MSCHDCGNKNNDCGCSQEALHISQVCNPVECDSDECTESFAAECIVYTGDDIVCDNVVIVTAGDSMAQAVANITAYFCTRTTTQADIDCGNDTVVAEGTDHNTALTQIVTYFCNAIENIELTPGPQGPAGAEGIDGQDGTKILSAYNSRTGIGNGAGASTVNAIVVSIPGNTLANDGDEYEVDLYLEYLQNDPVDLEIGIGAGAIWTRTVQDAENDKRFIKIMISRIDQNNQMWTITEHTQNALSQEFISEMDVIYTTKDLSTTENWTVNLINGGAAQANALTLHKAVLKLNKV